MQLGWRQQWHVRLMDYPKIFLAGLAEPTFFLRKDAKALGNSIIQMQMNAACTHGNAASTLKVAILLLAI
jgi:hypothetical protein